MSKDAERSLVLTYAPNAAAARALSALLMLDDRLGETVRAARDPMLGQIRLKWWHDALAELDGKPPPSEPVLESVARDVLTDGVRGAKLAAIAQAWAELFGAELDDEALERFAVRGRVLFALAGRISGADRRDPLELAGEGWALSDLACGLSDPVEVKTARGRAQLALDAALAKRWSRNARALGAMAHLARLDLAGSREGSPRRVGRLLWHRLSGR